MGKLLFDPKLKEVSKDLFDMDKGLGELEEAMGRGDSLIVVTGLRRMGKTYLMRVAPNVEPHPYDLVDLRRKVLSCHVYGFFTEDLSQPLRRRSALAGLLRDLRGVEVGGFGVSLKLRSEEGDDLAAVLDRLNALGERVVAFDSPAVEG